MVIETPVCGDGILTTSEGCDDSDTTTSDGCSWQKAFSYSNSCFIFVLYIEYDLSSILK